MNSVALQTIEMQIMFDDAFFENELNKQELVKNQSIESGRLIDDVFLLEKGCFALNKELQRLRRTGTFIQENILVSDFQE